MTLGFHDYGKSLKQFFSCKVVKFGYENSVQTPVVDILPMSLCFVNFNCFREEVRFTKRKDTRTGKAEETTFHLLHISLMREYIDHEFEELKVRTLEFFLFAWCTNFYDAILMKAVWLRAMKCLSATA